MVNVTVEFSFEDTTSAESVGWFLSDPEYECFRVGVSSGNYKSLSAQEPLRLVGGIEYLFVVEVDGDASHKPLGTYTVTSNNITLAHNMVNGKFYNEEGTFFVTPRN